MSAENNVEKLLRILSNTTDTLRYPTKALIDELGLENSRQLRKVVEFARLNGYPVGGHGSGGYCLKHYKVQIAYLRKLIMKYSRQITALQRRWQQENLTEYTNQLELTF